jgi:membrane-associated phospholipid phosphatase
MIGLVGYVLMPPARPWMFTRYGLVDGVNLESGFGALANPYAAMPSLHAADALIVGIFLFRASRHWWTKAIWALWPAWVWFCVLATANHFWLDVLAGIVVAIISVVIVSTVARRREQPAEGAPIANLL